MSPARFAFLLLVASLLGTIAPSAGHGQQPGTDDPPGYDATLERALAAHAQGDFAAAELAMREAHALAPSARTYRGLGVIMYSAGRYVDAVAPLEAALASHERPLEAALRASVEELLARVWQRVGRLQLRIELSHAGVIVDGKAPTWRAPDELLLAPGQHQIRIEAPGYEPYVVTLRSSPGSNDNLHVVLARASVSSAPAQKAAQAARPTPSRPAPAALPGWKPSHRNALLGSGAALVVAGGTSWLIGVLRFQELKKFCERRDGCEQQDLEDRYRQRRIAPLAITGAAITATGAAALLVAGAMELWQRSERKRIALGVSFGALRLSGQF